MEQDIIELIQKAQAGSEKAIERLIKKYKGIAINKAQKYYVNSGSYDDVLQEGIIGIYQGVNYYDVDSGKSLRKFLAMCVERSLIEYLKKDQTNKNYFLNTATSLDQDVNGHGFGDGRKNRTLYSHVENKKIKVEEKVTNQDYLRKALKLIKKHLTDMEYNCYLRYEYLGDSYKQIAEEMNTSRKAVDNALYRCRKKLDKLSPKIKERFGEAI